MFRHIRLANKKHLKNKKIIEGGLKSKSSENTLKSELKNIKSDIFKNFKTQK